MYLVGSAVGCIRSCRFSCFFERETKLYFPFFYTTIWLVAVVLGFRMSKLKRIPGEPLLNKGNTRATDLVRTSVLSCQMEAIAEFDSSSPSPKVMLVRSVEMVNPLRLCFQNSGATKQNGST